MFQEYATGSWNNADAGLYLEHLEKTLGKPSVVDRKAGGMAVFKNVGCYSRIEIKDESILNLAPIPHKEFVYSYINYEIPDKHVYDVIKLSGSISYDPIAKELRARGQNLEMNIATLALATQIGQGKISLHYAKENELLKAWIQNNETEKLYKLMCYNLKTQNGDPHQGGVFRLAHPDI